jgi:hypothetical protein
VDRVELLAARSCHDLEERVGDVVDRLSGTGFTPLDSSKVEALGPLAGGNRALRLPGPLWSRRRRWRYPGRRPSRGVVVLDLGDQRRAECFEDSLARNVHGQHWEGIRGRLA